MWMLARNTFRAKTRRIDQKRRWSRIATRLMLCREVFRRGHGKVTYHRRHLIKTARMGFSKSFPLPTLRYAWLPLIGCDECFGFNGYTLAFWYWAQIWRRNCSLTLQNIKEMSFWMSWVVLMILILISRVSIPVFFLCGFSYTLYHYPVSIL